MKDTVERVRFRGEEFILVETSLTTPEAYANGTVSYAHCYADGTIKRFGKVIGRVEELERLGPVEVEIRRGAFLNMLTHPSWYE